MRNDSGKFLTLLKPVASEDIRAIASADVVGLKQAAKSYGPSWKQRGGVGAFMMLARKWDRLEPQVKKHGWDVFKAIAKDQRPEGIIDDIRDLRRYLLLVEAEMRAQGAASAKATHRDNKR
jgi:hypothetical protein